VKTKRTPAAGVSKQLRNHQRHLALVSHRERAVERLAAFGGDGKIYEYTGSQRHAGAEENPLAVGRQANFGIRRRGGTLLVRYCLRRRGSWNTSVFPFVFPVN